MGRERQCTARYRAATSTGTLHLDTDELRFRGDFRLRIPLASIASVTVVGDALLVTIPDGEAAFDLGTQATRWADAIRNPPSLLDKLDVKPHSQVVVLGPTDPEFIATLAGRTPFAATAEALAPGTTYDLIFLTIAALPDLERIPTLTPHLASAGALWIIAPKGQRTLKEMDVLLAGRAAGLKDTKVARFSATHTAHKFVIPRERR